ncbi:MAG: N-acetyl-gamma-glutamyl-phosphate reductase [Pseudomonadota bacterium]
MTEPFLVGLIGARGHTGRELIRLIAGHPKFMLAYASSREFAGRPVSDVAPEDKDECLFENLGPEEAAKRRADAVFLALPDGAGAPFVEAFDRLAPQRVLIDLSADRRFDAEWAYGLPEVNRAAIDGARRIANPGCYATAAQLALAPIADRLAGAPSVFGVSGYSGAGSTPNPRNDPAALADSVIPYALVGHKHEREVSHRLGRDVRLSPHVHPAFRGLIATVHAPLDEALSQEAARSLYDERYQDEALVEVRDAPPTLKDGAGLAGAIVGGVVASDDGRHLAAVCALDNLLKGAATQALQNLNLAFGLPETLGILGTD